MVSRVKVTFASGRGVAERWRSQYQRDGVWTRVVSGDSEKIYNALCDLGHNADPAKVAEIIGNQSWSHLSCSACGDYVLRAVDFGCEHSDHGVMLCEPCVKDGASVITLTSI